MSSTVQLRPLTYPHVGGRFGGVERTGRVAIPPEMPLSDVQIRNLRPREKAYKVADFDGLYVLVMPTGSRLWRFKYRIGTKEKLLSIGRYPEIGLGQARAARDSARAILARGEDPGELKKERKREAEALRAVTFAAQADAFVKKVMQRAGLRRP